jgi:hypothetical protein
MSPTTQGEEDCFAITLVAQQCIEYQLQRLPGFEVLAIRQGDEMNTWEVRLQCRFQRVCIERRHGHIADNQRRRALGKLGEGLGIAQET